MYRVSEEGAIIEDLSSNSGEIPGGMYIGVI